MSTSTRGWPRSFVLAQWPNPPLWVALAAAVVGRLTSGRVHDYATGVFLVALAVWAYLEATGGANWFRRLLGAGFLVYVVVRIAGRVHA
ncbi:MAG: hypothetical protein ACXVFK_04040 [Solirubrobacteraceae bacterium]